MKSQMIRSETIAFCIIINNLHGERFNKKINASNISLQKCDQSLNMGILLYNGLVDFIRSIWDDFENLEIEAGNIFKNHIYK